MTQHDMILVDRGASGSVLVCPAPDCGREVLLTSAGGFRVITKGDPYALHGSGLDVVVDVQEG